MMDIKIEKWSCFLKGSFVLPVIVIVFNVACFMPLSYNLLQEASASIKGIVEFVLIIHILISSFSFYSLFTLLEKIKINSHKLNIISVFYFLIINLLTVFFGWMSVIVITMLVSIGVYGFSYFLIKNTVKKSFIINAFIIIIQATYFVLVNNIIM